MIPPPLNVRLSHRPCYLKPWPEMSVANNNSKLNNTNQKPVWKGTGDDVYKTGGRVGV